MDFVVIKSLLQSCFDPKNWWSPQTTPFEKYGMIRKLTNPFKGDLKKFTWVNAPTTTGNATA